MHLPTLTRVTVATATVQTVEVADPNVTARLEDAVALTLNGTVPKGWFKGQRRRWLILVRHCEALDYRGSGRELVVPCLRGLDCARAGS